MRGFYYAGQYLIDRGHDLEELVYGHSLGSLVFLYRTTAEDYAKLRTLSRTAKTWGDLRSALPRLRDHFPSVREVPNREPLKGELTSGPISDYWPFPHSEQIDILPADVVDLGEIDDTGEGDRLYLDDKLEPEILRRLTAHGIKFERDDDLVQAAWDG